MSLCVGVVIRYGCYWESLEYVGGEGSVIQVMYGEGIYNSICESVIALLEPYCSSNFIIEGLLDLGYGVQRVKVREDNDVYMVAQADYTPVLFVTYRVPRRHSSVDGGCHITHSVGSSSTSGKRALPFEDASTSDPEEDDIARVETDCGSSDHECVPATPEPESLLLDVQPSVTTKARSIGFWGRVKGFFVGSSSKGGMDTVSVGGSDNNSIRRGRDCEDLFVGALFHSKEDFNDAVGRKHIEGVGQYRVKRSDRKYITVVCKQDSCSFVIKVIGQASKWVVSEVVEHTCQHDPRFAGPRKLRSTTIGSYYAGRAAKGLSALNPKSMIAELLHRNGVTASYNVALRAKHKAIDVMYGDETTSFAQLPSYLHMLKTVNPGTFVALKVDDTDHKFQNAFFALGASVEGYRQFGRPVIVVDGTHLKGKYNGVVFVAATQDGNRQIFPLGIGVGHLEDDMSWSWFLTELRRAFPPQDGMVFVSDEHKSIASAICRVYPEAVHCFCYRHMEVKVSKSGKIVASLFKEVAFGYSSVVYERAMRSIAEIKPKVAEDLFGKDPKRWARSQCPVRRFEFMTSNAAESFNSRIVEPHKLPITSVLESIRRIIEQWFFERRTTANKSESGVTDVVATDVLKSVQLGMSLDVSQANTYMFSVRDGVEIHTADLSRNSFSCGYFQQMLIPCQHAATAVRTKNYDILSYVDNYYTVESLVGLWSGLVFPVPDPTTWRVPAAVLGTTCYPPQRQINAGRPRMSRYGAGKYRRRNVRGRNCKRCDLAGHNALSCPTNVPPPEPSSPKNLAHGEMVVGPRGCGPDIDPYGDICCICYEATHTYHNCPYVEDAHQ